MASSSQLGVEKAGIGARAIDVSNLGQVAQNNFKKKIPPLLENFDQVPLHIEGA